MTSQRRVRGVDLLYPAWCLVRQARADVSPSGRVDGQVQPRRWPHVPPRRGDGAARGTDHVADLQILDTNQVETAVQVRGGPLHPVLSSEITQRLLLHLLRTLRQPSELSPSLGQLTGLLRITRRTGSARPPRLVRFNREIPYISGVRAMFRQRLLLSRRGHESEPQTSTLTTTTDILRRKRRYLPGLEAGVRTPRNL